MYHSCLILSIQQVTINSKTVTSDCFSVIVWAATLEKPHNPLSSLIKKKKSFALKSTSLSHSINICEDLHCLVMMTQAKTKNCVPNPWEFTVDPTLVPGVNKACCDSSAEQFKTRQMKKTGFGDRTGKGADLLEEQLVFQLILRDQKSPGLPRCTVHLSGIGLWHERTVPCEYHLFSSQWTLQSRVPYYIHSSPACQISR